MEPISEHDWTIHALNIHGTFFERWSAAFISHQPGWEVAATQYPVRFPPDANVHGNASAIDIVAQTLRRHKLTTLVVECKKNNPEFVNWILFPVQSYPQLSIPLLTYGSFGTADAAWRMVRQLVASRMPIVDDARETRGQYAKHKKRDDKTRTTKATISEAAYQTALGAQALAWDELSRAKSVDAAPVEWEPREWKEEAFLPVILTTANLRIAEFDPAKVSPTTGEIAYADVNFRDVPFALYDYALPRHLHLPSSPLETLPTQDSVNLWSRLTIAIVNSEHLVEFLRSDLILSAAGYPVPGAA